jgi:hypothetical protein
MLFTAKSLNTDLIDIVVIALAIIIISMAFIILIGKLINICCDSFQIAFNFYIKFNKEVTFLTLLVALMEIWSRFTETILTLC